MKPAVFAETRTAGFIIINSKSIYHQFKIQDKGRQHSGQLLEMGGKCRNFAA